MASKTSRFVLPRFSATETCAAASLGANKVELPDGSSYFYKPKLLPNEELRTDGKPAWNPREFSVYPIVMTADGTPWDEANAWILSSIEDQYVVKMPTYRGKAEDLQHLRNFIDDRGIVWTDFPVLKQMRPLYRYQAHLNVELELGAMTPSVAKRRMSTAVNFYRWLIRQRLFVPANPPWEERKISFSVTNSYGRNTLIHKTTTDVSIKNVKVRDPYDPFIEDGGKLRPLPAQEQGWIIGALAHLRNTEQTLIHALALSTGGRIQTILTIRKHHVLREYRNGDARLRCGPGTGIDTKGDVPLTLLIPDWLMNALRTYALSARAIERRKNAPGGDVDEQYLFLSVRSAPMYEASQKQFSTEGKAVRHVKNGQAVRMYMKDYVIPFIRKHYDAKFRYKIHDLRASFGMNMVDEMTPRMDRGEVTYTQVLSEVMARMNHSSPVVTERYLQYRRKRKFFEAAQDQWEGKLQDLVNGSMAGYNCVQ